MPLILYGIVALFLAGGGALIWHSIGANAVAKHEQQQKVEQDKIDAVAKVKEEAAAAAVIDMDAAFKEGERKGRANAPRVAGRVQADRVLYPVFQNPDCKLPAQSLELYKAALATLHKGDLSDTMLNAPAALPPVAPPTPAPAARGAVNPLVPR